MLRICEVLASARFAFGQELANGTADFDWEFNVTMLLQLNQLTTYPTTKLPNALPL